ncbi:MAG: hypothetical protein P8163_14235 [Candidatus Thiodiazotropha sp.]
MISAAWRGDNADSTEKQSIKSDFSKRSVSRLCAGSLVVVTLNMLDEACSRFYLQSSLLSNSEKLFLPFFSCLMIEVKKHGFPKYTKNKR